NERRSNFAYVSILSLINSQIAIMWGANAIPGSPYGLRRRVSAVDTRCTAAVISLLFRCSVAVFGPVMSQKNADKRRGYRRFAATAFRRGTADCAGSRDDRAAEAPWPALAQGAVGQLARSAEPRGQGGPCRREPDPAPDRGAHQQGPGAGARRRSD